jgi:hypothetical protein
MHFHIKPSLSLQLKQHPHAPAVVTSARSAAAGSAANSSAKPHPRPHLQRPRAARPAVHAGRPKAARRDDAVAATAADHPLFSGEQLL